MQDLGSRALFKSGIVIAIDQALGDFARGDVLEDGARIVAVGLNLEPQVGDAQIIDCANTIVMPGFVDTYRHMWEGVLRNLIPDKTLPEYLRAIVGEYGVACRAEDACISDLLGAWSALDAGVTTVLDWSHIHNTPDHADAIR